jgi:hypothetical protein
LLNYEWEKCVIGSDDVNIIFNNLFSSFQNVVEEYIPRKTVVSPHDKPWMDGNVR